MVRMGPAEKILAGLAALRDEDTLCDVELMAEQQTISAHRNVLAAASPYFKAMFSGQFKETRSKVVAIEGITATELKQIIDYIYTTKIEITAENIEYLLPAVHLMQMTDIVEHCTVWMNENITETNCFTLLQLAEKYSIQSIVCAVEKFVMANFVSVCETSGFSGISQQALCKYLSSDTLKTDINEFAVYKAAKYWIQENKITDAKVVTEILANVRFAFVEPDKLTDEILCDSIIASNTGCLKMFGEAMKYHLNPRTQPLYKGDLNRPRGLPSLLLISSGKLQNTQSFASAGADPVHLLNFPNFENEGIATASIKLPMVIESLSSVQIGNFLFVFRSNNEGFRNFTKRYNGSTNTWKEMTPVPRESTIGSVATSVTDKIFLLGGMFVNKKTKYSLNSKSIMDRVLIYDISNNSWREGVQMPQRLMYSGATTLHSSIYVTGGVDPGGLDGVLSTVAKVHAFDIKANLWLVKESMNHPRCQHVLEACEDRLYAIAGRVIGGENTTSIEEYDPIVNQWSVIQIECLKAIGASSFVVDQNIYIVGGSDAQDGVTVYNVTVYDVDKKKLDRMEGHLPYTANCWRNVSAYLISPKLL